MSAALKQGRLSLDEEQAVINLAACGWKAGRIAMKLDRIPTTISYAMTRLGLRAPTPRSYTMTRHGRPVIFFDTAEDAMIETLRAEGLSCAKIAAACFDRFGRVRSGATVGLRLKMLAARETAA